MRASDIFETESLEEAPWDGLTRFGNPLRNAGDHLLHAAFGRLAAASNGKIETRVVARKMFADWRKYAGQQYDAKTRAELPLTVGNLKTFLQSFYGLNIDISRINSVISGTATAAPKPAEGGTPDAGSATPPTDGPPPAPAPETPGGTPGGSPPSGGEAASAAPAPLFKDSHGTPVTPGSRFAARVAYNVKVRGYDPRTKLVSVTHEPTGTKTSFHLDVATRHKMFSDAAGGTGPVLFKDRDGKDVRAGSSMDLHMWERGKVDGYDAKDGLVKVSWDDADKEGTRSVRLDHLLKMGMVKESLRHHRAVITEDVEEGSDAIFKHPRYGKVKVKVIGPAEKASDEKAYRKVKYEDGSEDFAAIDNLEPAPAAETPKADEAPKAAEPAEPAAPASDVTDKLIPKKQIGPVFLRLAQEFIRTGHAQVERKPRTVFKGALTKSGVPGEPRTKATTHRSGGGESGPRPGSEMHAPASVVSHDVEDFARALASKLPSALAMAATRGAGDPKRTREALDMTDPLVAKPAQQIMADLLAMMAKRGWT